MSKIRRKLRLNEVEESRARGECAAAMFDLPLEAVLEIRRQWLGLHAPVSGDCGRILNLELKPSPDSFNYELKPAAGDVVRLFSEEDP